MMYHKLVKLLHVYFSFKLEAILLCTETVKEFHAE